jgi:hypothetical protein
MNENEIALKLYHELKNTQIFLGQLADISCVEPDMPVQEVAVTLRGEIILINHTQTSHYVCNYLAMQNVLSRIEK